MIKTKHNHTFKTINLALSPEEVAASFVLKEGLVFLDSAIESGDSISIVACEPDCILSGEATDWQTFSAALATRARISPDTGLPAGAAIGWTAYDGSFRYGFYENLLIYLHRERRWLAFGNPPIPDCRAASVTAPASQPHFESQLRREDFEEMVRVAQGYITSGDIYQVCLAHEFRSAWSGSGWPFYEALRQASPAPYAGYLSLGGTEVLSASPECFLNISGRRILTRPIKGTRPRGVCAETDERSACELITSPKEIAELVMITDLERNDLGRVCEYGSVRVTDLLRLETFEQVFHLVSTVEGLLRPDITHTTAIEACFPGGSISGAPKRRARQIIEELERKSRGIYTGSIGFFGFNDETRLNIAIRTLVIENGMASFHVGAGIVADSKPESEWQETLDKAAGILSTAGAMRLK